MTVPRQDFSFSTMSSRVCVISVFSKFSQKWVRKQIVQIYTENNPVKLSMVDGFFMEYAGRERLLYDKVCLKYAVDALPTPLPRARARSL